MGSNPTWGAISLHSSAAEQLSLKQHVVGSTPTGGSIFAWVAQWYRGKVRQNMFKIFTACRKVNVANKRYAYFNLRTINRQEHPVSNWKVGGSIPSRGTIARDNSSAISLGSSPSSRANFGQGICLSNPRSRTSLDHQGWDYGLAVSLGSSPSPTTNFFGV